MEYIIERGVRIVPKTSWEPVLQRSINAFYEGEFSEGRNACLTLLAEPALPPEVRELTYRNQTFYAQPLRELVEGAQLKAQQVPGQEGWEVHSLSPFLAGDRLMVYLRVTPGEAGQASTDVLLTLDNDLGVAEMNVLDNDTGEAASIQDARPFILDGVLQAGVILYPPQPGGPVRAGVVDIVDRAWQNLRSFGPRVGQFKAGWSPLVTGAGIRFVSWWEPTEVFWFDAETREFKRVALRMAPHVAERFQGSSQGVSVPGGCLFLVSEQISFGEGPPLIFNRFVLIDDGFQITAISPQFYASRRGQDAASGLTRKDDQLVAGFRTDGREALLATMDLEATLAILIPVDAPGRSVTQLANRASQLV